MEWLEENRDRYHVIPLDYSYSNSNYQAKGRDSVSEEVLVINYESRTGQSYDYHSGKI